MSTQQIVSSNFIEEVEAKQAHTGLLKIEITRIINVSNYKMTSSVINLKIGSQGYMDKFSMSSEQLDLNKVHMFECHPDDQLQMELVDDKSDISAYVKFGLKELCKIQRVKHILDIIMIQRKKKTIVTPIKDILQLEMEMLFINGAIGKFVVHSMQIQLTRNTELIGKMDPYIVMEIDGTTLKTSVKKEEGKHAIWTNKYQFQIKHVSSTKLNFQVFDEDTIKNDLVGQAEVSMLKSNLLLPLQKSTFFDIHLIYEGKSAGIAHIQYTFELHNFKVQ